MISIPRFGVFAAAIICLAVIAFGFFALNLNNSMGNSNVASVQTVGQATKSDPAESMPSVQSGSNELHENTHAQDSARDLPTDFQKAEGTSSAEEPATSDSDSYDRREAPGMEEVQDPPQPDVVFEDLDPATVREEIRQKYEEGGHRRYRFVNIDGASLRQKIAGLAPGDVLDMEFFPGELVSPIQGYPRTRQVNGRVESESLLGRPLANIPCSSFTMTIDAQGNVSVRSFHQHAPVLNVELTGQNSIYAITQSMNIIDPTCGGQILPGGN